MQKEDENIIHIHFFKATYTCLCMGWATYRRLTNTSCRLGLHMDNTTTILKPCYQTHRRKNKRLGKKRKRQFYQSIHPISGFTRHKTTKWVKHDLWLVKNIEMRLNFVFNVEEFRFGVGASTKYCCEHPCPNYFASSTLFYFFLKEKKLHQGLKSKE